MAGYQTIEALRPILHKGPPATPIVCRALVRPEKPFVSRQGLPTPAPIIAEMIARRQVGESLHKIATDLRVGHTTVLRHTKHIKPPPGGWPNGWANGTRKRKLTRIEFAERLYRSGYSFGEIAANVNCTKSTVQRHFTGRENMGRRLILSEITRRVVQVTRFKTAELKQTIDPAPGRREAEIARVRAVLFWLGRRRSLLSHAEIGARLGGFDKSSVRAGIARVDQVIDLFGIDDRLPIGKLTRALLLPEWPKASA